VHQRNRCPHAKGLKGDPRAGLTPRGGTFDKIPPIPTDPACTIGPIFLRQHHATSGLAPVNIASASAQMIRAEVWTQAPDWRRCKGISGAAPEGPLVAIRGN